MASTPDHLLAYIFELAVEDTFGLGRVRLLQRFNLVCRRFRRVALDSPRLWSSFFLGHDDLRLPELYLKRSRLAGLRINVRLSCDGDGLLPQASQMLDDLLLHSDRWEYLSVCIPVVEAGREDTVLKRLSIQRLPRLKSISIEYPEDSRDVPTSFHFYTSCELLNLRALQLSYLSPMLFNCPSLTSFTATVNLFFDPVELLQFLDATRSLEEIDFCFESVDFMRNSGRLQDVALPNIRTLEITIDSSSIYALMPLRRVLLTPNIRKAVFCINSVHEADYCIGSNGDDDDDDYDGRYNQYFLGDLTRFLNFMLYHDVYPTIIDFAFKADNIPISKFAGTYEIPFWKMPCLRILTLETNNTSPRFGLDDPFLPPLSHIHVKGLHEKWIIWLKSLHHLLTERNKLSGLECLFIDGGGRNYYKVSELFEGTRTVWNTYEPNFNPYSSLSSKG